MSTLVPSSSRGESKCQIKSKIQMSNQIQNPNVKRIRNVVITLVVSFCLFPVVASAAELYLEPSEGQYHIGDTFLLDIRLDSQGQYINTAQVDLEFSSDVLLVKEFSRGDSILTLWVKEPEFDNDKGVISFSGGVPGGYFGDNGLLGRVVFQVINSSLSASTEIKFSNTSQVLLNDGVGTVADLSRKGAFLPILTRREIPRNEWARVLLEDKTAPESFDVVIQKDPLIFQGKHFVVFSTDDKQSGIDYYEVKEGEDEWQKVKSPHLLKDQSLKNPIIVRAVDKAGNQRIIYYPGRQPWLEILSALFVFIVLIVVFLWLVRKRKNKMKVK